MITDEQLDGWLGKAWEYLSVFDDKNSKALHQANTRIYKLIQALRAERKARRALEEFTLWCTPLADEMPEYPDLKTIGKEAKKALATYNQILEDK